jgi:hypothetical protein
LPEFPFIRVLRFYFLSHIFLSRCVMKNECAAPFTLVRDAGARADSVFRTDARGQMEKKDEDAVLCLADRMAHIIQEPFPL